VLQTFKGLSALNAPRELVSELNRLFAALGAVIAAAPDQTLIIGRDGLHDKKICVEVLEIGDVVFSIAPGTAQ
jgi:hypothetical protein